MTEKMSLKDWLPLVGLTASAFIFNTSEFMPIGLLSDIAADLHITEAHAGMLISVYAWAVALLSLPLMLIVCRMEYKRLLLCITALFVVSHVFSALSTGFWTLMASRIGVACSHSVFWSIASPLAVRTVPAQYRSVALGTIVTGSSIAMIVGLPVGRIIGLYMGWRMTFLTIAILSFIILIYLFVVFPKVPNRNKFSPKRLPTIFRSQVLVGIFLLTVLIATAHYTAYSYIEPFLSQVGKLSESNITLSLTVFGAAGLLGSVMFSRLFERHQYTFLSFVVASVAICLLLLYAASYSMITILLVCILWGAVITAFNVALQAEIIRFASQDSTAVAMSIFSGIFNLGIGCGALFGGTVSTHLSIGYVGFTGGAIASIATIYCLFRLIKVMKQCGNKV